MKMKSLKYTILAMLSSVLLISCGGKSSSANETTSGSDAKAKKFAENLCKMAKDIGLDQNFKFTDEFMRNNGDKMENKFYENSNKLIVLLKEIESHMKTLNQAQSQKFTKELMKAIIDTECSDILLKEVPYSEFGKVISEMEKEITRMKYRRDNPDDLYGDYDTTMNEEPMTEAVPEMP